jgi:uncharacterized Ntn-hydrolase superfamily protein
VTFSIVARCPRTGALGAAVASASLACAAHVLNVRGGVGAIASQASGNPFYAPDGLRLLAEGHAPEDIIATLTAPDPYRELRQLLIVDANGNTAGFTGSECLTAATHRAGNGYIAGGNRLAEGVIDAMCAAFESSAEKELSERLLLTLEAGDAEGGDRGGRQSAGMLVAEHPDFARYNLRVDDHEAPLPELRRLLALRIENLGKFGMAGFTPTRERPLPPGFLEKWTELKKQYEVEEVKS